MERVTELSNVLLPVIVCSVSKVTRLDNSVVNLLSTYSINTLGVTAFVSSTSPSSSGCVSVIVASSTIPAFSVEALGNGLKEASPSIELFFVNTIPSLPPKGILALRFGVVI